MTIAQSFALFMANFVVMSMSLFVGLTIIALTAILCINIFNKFAKE